MPQLQPTCRYCTIESIQRGRGGGGGGRERIQFAVLIARWGRIGREGGEREGNGGGGGGELGCRCKLSSEVSGMCMERWIGRDRVWIGV